MKIFQFVKAQAFGALYCEAHIHALHETIDIIAVYLERAFGSRGGRAEVADYKDAKRRFGSEARKGHCSIVLPAAAHFNSP